MDRTGVSKRANGASVGHDVSRRSSSANLQTVDKSIGGIEMPSSNGQLPATGTLRPCILALRQSYALTLKYPNAGSSSFQHLLVINKVLAFLTLALLECVTGSFTAKEPYKLACNLL